MKKLFVTLLFTLILCVALQPAVLAASDSIDIEINGRQLSLMFDRSEQFSNITDGNVQASFYTYLDDSNDLYELYLIFPQDVESGTTLDPEYAFKNAPETSVVMIVTSNASVDYYFAGQAEDSDGADYTMNFESVTDSEAGRTYSGTLSASMIGMSGDTEMEITPLTIQNAHFSFTMPLNGDGSADESPYEIIPPEDELPYEEYTDDYLPFVSPEPTREVYRV